MTTIAAVPTGACEARDAPEQPAPRGGEPVESAGEPDRQQPGRGERRREPQAVGGDQCNAEPGARPVR
jgi:hypothetical protein